MTEEHIFRSVTRTGIQKLRKIKAETFELAKEKAIELYSHIKYFKQTMDLQTALARAAKASLTSGRPYYIIVDEEEGECSVNTAPIGTATHKFVKGVEDKTFASKKHSPVKELADEVIEEIPQEKIKKSKQKEIMSTKVAVKKSKVVAKKVVKKTMAKKIAKSPKPRVINWHKSPKPEWGKKVKLSIETMVAKAKTGKFQYRDPQGVIQSIEYMKGRANQEYVRECFEAAIKG